MSAIEAKLQELGLALPEPVKLPPGVKLPFAFVRVRGNRAYISGHGPQDPDGSISHPRGKVGWLTGLEPVTFGATTRRPRAGQLARALSPSATSESSSASDGGSTWLPWRTNTSSDLNFPTSRLKR